MLLRISSVLIKDGAKVLEEGVPSLDLSRLCRGTLPVCTNAPPREACDCVRAWDVGVDMVESGEPGGKATDFGLPTEAGLGETDAFLEKGLLRVCAMLCELETIVQNGQSYAARRVADIRSRCLLGSSGLGRGSKSVNINNGRHDFRNRRVGIGTYAENGGEGNLTQPPALVFWRNSRQPSTYASVVGLFSCGRLGVCSRWRGSGKHGRVWLGAGVEPPHE